MQPVFDEGLAARLDPRALALRDLILVMGEHEVFAPQMQVKAWPEEFHAHGAALNVPAGPAFAPRAGPEHRAVLRRARFPEREVSNGFLLILITANALAHPQIIKVELHQLPIARASTAVFLDAALGSTVWSLPRDPPHQTAHKHQNNPPHPPPPPPPPAPPTPLHGGKITKQ